jgi:hypothetical protein
LAVNYGALDGHFHASKICHFLKVCFLWTMRAG